MSIAVNLANLADGVSSEGVLASSQGGTGTTTGGGGAGTDQSSTSTGFFDLPSGTTAQRPASPTTGNIRYNTTTGFAEVYTSAGWGTFGAQLPFVGTVSPITYNGEQGTVFTINGANFTSDATVSFIDSANNIWQAGTVVFLTSGQLTATTPKDFTVADGPLDVKVTQSNGTITKTDCIDCGGSPVWTTSAGTIATIIDEYGSYSPIVTVTATDPDNAGTVVSYGLTTGSLPAGTSLNTTTGAISGNPTNVANQTTSTFSLTATDNAGNTSARSFSIIVNPAPDGTTSAKAGTSASAIKTLTSTTTNGNYWILVNGTAKQVYCDMTNDGGGWMLWQTFGNGSAFQSGFAILPTGNTGTQMTTNGWTVNTTGWAINSNNVGVGLPCSSQGYADINAIGATLTTTPTLLRTQYANTHVVSTVEIFTNGVSRGSASPGQTITATSVPINFAGTTPVFRILEYNAIMAFYWMMIK